MPAADQSRRQRVSPAADPAAAYRHLLSVRRRNKHWRLALTTLAVVVMAGAAATVAVSLAGHRSSPRGSSQSAAPPSSASSSTTSIVPSGAGPTITSLSPSSGSAGELVTISGVGLISSNGQVLAYFGTEQAPTSCADASSCSATVPAGDPGPETVTVTTSAGTSNGLTFTYQ